MDILVVFVLGIANFALHKAVLESRHPMFAQARGSPRRLAVRISLSVEFAVLFGALLLVANGWSAIAWAYAVYTAISAASAWLICTGRV